LGVDLDARIEALKAAAMSALAAQGVGSEAVEVQVTAHLRYEGGEATLPIAWGGDLAPEFEERHRHRFGFADPARAILVAKISVEAVGRDESPTRAVAALPTAAPKPVATVQVRAGGAAHATPVYRRGDLPAGFAVSGPALVLENGATTFVEPNWRASLNAQ